MGERLVLLPRSEPFFYEGNGVGCLMIHGFTGVSAEVRELGEMLAGEGYTVFGPRLAHHGTHPADMNRSRWRDWYFSALDGYRLLQARCDRIVPVGLSMGGATALLLAAWEEVSAVVSMAAPIALPEDWRLRFTRPLSNVYPFDPPLEADWRESIDLQAHISYPVNPVYAIAELHDYLAVVRENLPDVTVPALLLQAADDATVPPINLGEIERLIGSSQKEVHLYEEGGHVVTEGVVKEAVMREVLGFIGRVLEGGDGDSGGR